MANSDNLPVIAKIISGGQTGADRAALDWAIEHGIQHGGWCPAGRLAEDGVIPERYQLLEVDGGYRQRTRRNIRDSDGTLIVSIVEELTGGTLETRKYAEKIGKPWLHVWPGIDWRVSLAEWLAANDVRVLNVAGPRASKEPEGVQFVREVLDSAANSAKPTPASYGVVLVKILPACWLNDFLDGRLYLNTGAYFASIDRSDSVRHDPHDGVDDARQVVSVEIQDEAGKWIPIGGIINPVTFRSSESEKFNVLCTYMMTDLHGATFDERNLQFGDTAVYITNPVEFLRRVKAAAAEAGKDVLHRPVEYVPRDLHDGKMGPFRKFSEYEYQSEFRIVLTGGNGEACRLAVGNLRDISAIGPSSSIPTMWQHLSRESP